MFEDFDQDAVAGPSFIPDRRLVEGHVVQRAQRRGAGEGQVFGIAERTQRARSSA
jgi:hypothetical protein